MCVLSLKCVQVSSMIDLHRTCEVSVNSWVRAKGKTLKTQNMSEFFIILITPSDLSD